VDETLAGKGFKKKVRFFPGGKFANMLKGLSVAAASEVLDVKDEDEPEP